MGETEAVGLPGLLVAGIVGMMLLAMAIIVFFVVYQRRLYHQQEEMNRREAEYQKELLQASIQSQEVERKRIASDLHDSVGSLLSATKMYLKQIGVGSGDNIADIKAESLSLVNETIQNVRQISHNLLPPMLERFGFIAALESLAEKINKSGVVRFSVDCPVQKRFDLEKELGLYRIVQELTNNTIKHAQAKNIVVSILFEKADLLFIYQDDGIGFEMENTNVPATRKKGLGLRSLESRTNFLNASIEISTKIGGGVKVSVAMPLDKV